MPPVVLPADLDQGELPVERHKVLTPQPSQPDAVADCVAEVAEHFGWKGSGRPVGITFPGVVTSGTVRTAANVDKGWIDLDAATLRPVSPNAAELDVRTSAAVTGSPTPARPPVTSARS